MPLVYPDDYRLKILPDASGVLTQNNASRFNLISCTEETRVLTLSSSFVFHANCSIVIRNDSASIYPVNIEFDGFIADVSPELGLAIPPGGIVELKKLGTSNVWSVYGYIQTATPVPTSFALCHLDGTNGQTTIQDAVNGEWACSGGASLSTANPKFGSASLSLKGTTDECVYSETIPAGAGDFTFEFQVKSIFTGVGFRQLYGWGSYALTISSAGSLLFYNGVADVITIPVSELSTTEYNPIAIVRAGTITVVYINGIAKGSSANLNADLSASQLKFGRNTPNALNSCISLVDEVRISSNARYLSNYTPATAPFTS